MNATNPSSHTAQQKKGIIYTIVAIVAIVALILGLFFNKMLSPRVLSKAELAANGAISFETPRIIKPFQLVDHKGSPFTLENLQGNWTLLFFGFTTCPDICPTTLAQLSRAVKSLDADILKKTQVVLVSVDPARDTPEKLKPYLEHFNPDFVGVTGDFLPIKRLADNLNVAFNRVVMGDDYSVDHSGNIILVNPYGHYAGFFKPPFELARLKLTYQSIVTVFD